MTYVIRSNGKREEFDEEKLLASIMEAASDAGLLDDPRIQAMIKNAISNTVSYSQDKNEIQSKTLKNTILSQLIKIGIQMAIQKFGANRSKDDILTELLNAGLEIPSRRSRANISEDVLSEILNNVLNMYTENSNSYQSNDILSELLGAGSQTYYRTSNVANEDLSDLLETGMKLANAWMEYSKASGKPRP